jgi:hypothetical protein
VRNLAGAADWLIVSDFTDLHVVVVCDNGRHDTIAPVLDQARMLAGEGLSPRRVVRECGLAQLAQRASSEERALVDLIERAIIRNATHRIHLYLLPWPDIIELLPPSSFGLAQPWSALRREYARAGVKPVDFKSWLRATRNAGISMRSIGKAFDELDTVPEPLHGLLREIEVVSSLAPLDR